MVAGEEALQRKRGQEFLKYLFLNFCLRCDVQGSQTFSVYQALSNSVIILMAVPGQMKYLTVLLIK